ncbi:MAG TPA: metallophosphoesterase family protein [Pirellulales bacterium]|nr:metallophosphoesterase family protein [Pirellulales bacterium]
MLPRLIAIGDIHGCSAALRALLHAIAPQPEDTIVSLGDYVDRGLDSRGVLDELIALADRCRLIPILGNHDEMMLHARDGKDDLRFWLECGGQAALDSYGDGIGVGLNAVPRDHFRFLASCRAYFETETHFFTHANYRPEVPLDRQDEQALRWLSLRDHLPGPHICGKTAIVGHTPHREVLNLGHLVCLDTDCCHGGWLSAMDVATGRIWQADEAGRTHAIQSR